MQAFGLLDGWGSRNEKDVFVVHSFERRKKLAEQLVDWASAEKHTEAEGD